MLKTIYYTHLKIIRNPDNSDEYYLINTKLHSTDIMKDVEIVDEIHCDSRDLKYCLLGNLDRQEWEISSILYGNLPVTWEEVLSIKTALTEIEKDIEC